MSHISEIRNILPDATVLVGEFSLTYIKCLMPMLKSPKTLLLHRKESHLEYDQHTAINFNDEDVSELDVTGSPLKYELGYSKLEETIIDCRNWGKEEELQLPLTRLEACVALNCCLEHIADNDWRLPLLALCDGTDNDRTVILGSHVEDGWYTTIKAQIADAQQLSKIEETPAVLFKDYTNNFSIQEHKVCTSVISTYVFCGKRPGLADLSDIHDSTGFECSASLEVHWNTLSFYAPIRASSTVLIMEIIAGSNKSSNMINLWKELTVLHQYLNMLEEFRNNEPSSYPLISPNPVAFVDVERKLNLLLNGGNENIQSWEDDNYDKDEFVMDNVELKKHLHNVLVRQNIDFTDMLWELLTKCSNYDEIRTCMHTVLNEIQSGCVPPQTNPSNTTRINKIISDMLDQKKIVPMLDKNLPLELLIDAGLEKLCRDYMYIMLSAKLIDIHHLQQTLCNVQTGSFNIETYRVEDKVFLSIEKKSQTLATANVNAACANGGPIEVWKLRSNLLLPTINFVTYLRSGLRMSRINLTGSIKKLASLAQIHLCIEFAILAQSYLNCPTANLQPIFTDAFRKYVSKNSNMKTFEDLQKNSIQCLKVPLPTITVEHIVQGLPSSWCLTLSYQSNTDKISTTSHLSRIPILPPNIYGSGQCNEHGDYHFLKLHSSSTKIV